MACASEPLDSVSSLKLEETLNCPICLEVYTTPKALACLHTFCETCIHAHITKLSETGELNGKICCPVCRVASPPPDRNKPLSDWARLLPMNYAILPILETVQSKERVSKKIFCGSCSDRDNPAVNFCTDCQMNICGNCVECHKKYKMLQSHTIAELGDITKCIVEKSGKQAVGVDFCDEHPGKAIKYFCEEHGMLLCSSCVIVSHRPCNKVTGLKEMGRELRNGNEIKKLQTELKAVQPVLEGITKALEDNVIQIKEEADALPNRVKELQDKAMKVFDDLYQHVLTQCNNLKKTYTLNVSNEAFNCKSLVAAVESSLITLANVKENGSDIQLFITFHKLEQQMKKYKESLDKMVTDTECTKLKLQIDTTLEQAVSKPRHTANVTAHQFTPDMIAAMKTAVGTEAGQSGTRSEDGRTVAMAGATAMAPKQPVVSQSGSRSRGGRDVVMTGAPEMVPMQSETSQSGSQSHDSSRSRDSRQAAMAGATAMHPMQSETSQSGSQSHDSSRSRDSRQAAMAGATAVHPMQSGTSQSGSRSHDERNVSRSGYAAMAHGKQSWPNHGQTSPTYISSKQVVTGNQGDGNGKDTKQDTSEDCVICGDVMTDPKQLSCGHSFCTDCIDQHFTYKQACPICGAVCGIITGDQPDGEMQVHVQSIVTRSSIQITYTFPNGRQGPRHPNPGHPYRGISYTAYLPDNEEGQLILAMLKVAFKRKLIFTIGRSRTTGKEDVITWNDIHHKTNPPNWLIGYPDQTYLTRVKDDLAAKGVTEADVKGTIKWKRNR